MPKRSIAGPARDAVRTDAKTRKAFSAVTKDSFQNFAAQLGIGTGNLTSFNTYGFNPITRVHTLLEWIHRGSWVGGVAVDIVADDMTRAGVHLKGELKPDKIEQINESATQLGVWSAVNDVIKWARLFGGAIGVLLIDGQDPSTEFRIKTVGKDQFRGIMALDRWMVEPSLNNLVMDYGVDLGLPKYYTVSSYGPAFPNMKIHYTRCIRLEGIRLPWYQRLIENLWGLSVLERLYDRMTAFDAASTGAAQLVHKLHLRTYKLEGLRDIVNQGGDALLGLSRYVDMMRKFQSIEGMTIMDKEDEFEAASGAPSVQGVEPLLIHFGQQLSGALGIPLVRLFGQSPVGLNATGESDLIMYYDNILQQQEARLRVPVTTVYRCIAQSLGIKLPDGFSIGFNPLWQLKDSEKATVAQTVTSAVVQAQEAGIISQQTAMRELRQNSDITGVYSNITDTDINAAEVELPPGLPVEEEVAEIKTAGKEKNGAVQDAEDPAQMGGAAINRELEKIRQLESKLTNKFIAAGRGNERPSEYLTKSDTLALEARALFDRKSALLYEAKRRYGPDFTIGMKLSGPIKSYGRDNSAANVAWCHDLQVVIENPAGTERRGYGWTVKMPADYGYVRRVDGADGDALDCYIGPAPESTSVFIIDQRNLQTGEFDEHKVMLGYHVQESAVEDYLLGYTDGSGVKRMMHCTPVSMDAFKAWMQQGDLTKPFAQSGMVQ